jgi:hypothetical protein
VFRKRVSSTFHHNRKEYYGPFPLQRLYRPISPHQSVNDIREVDLPRLGVLSVLISTINILVPNESWLSTVFRALVIVSNLINQAFHIEDYHFETNPHFGTPCITSLLNPLDDASNKNIGWADEVLTWTSISASNTNDKYTCRQSLIALVYWQQIVSQGITDKLRMGSCYHTLLGLSRKYK